MTPASCQRQRIGVMGRRLRNRWLSVHLTVPQPRPGVTPVVRGQACGADSHWARLAPYLRSQATRPCAGLRPLRRWPSRQRPAGAAGHRPRSRGGLAHRLVHHAAVRRPQTRHRPAAEHGPQCHDRARQDQARQCSCREPSAPRGLHRGRADRPAGASPGNPGKRVGEDAVPQARPRSLPADLVHQAAPRPLRHLPGKRFRGQPPREDITNTVQGRLPRRVAARGHDEARHARPRLSQPARRPQARLIPAGGHDPAGGTPHARAPPAPPAAPAAPAGHGS
jgi:hypothetical protein